MPGGSTPRRVAKSHASCTHGLSKPGATAGSSNSRTPARWSSEPVVSEPGTTLSFPRESRSTGGRSVTRIMVCSAHLTTTLATKGRPRAFTSRRRLGVSAIFLVERQSVEHCAVTAGAIATFRGDLSLQPVHRVVRPVLRQEPITVQVMNASLKVVQEASPMVPLRWRVSATIYSENSGFFRVERIDFADRAGQIGYRELLEVIPVRVILARKFP